MSARVQVGTLAERKRSLGLPPVLELFILVMVFLAGLCVLAERAATTFYWLGAPYDSPFLHERFPDLLYFEPRFKFLHRLEFFTFDPLHPFMYPAPAALPYVVIYGSGHPIRFYLGLVLLAVFAFAVLAGWMLRRRGLRWTSTLLLLVATIFLSYPTMYLMRQANVEAVVWIVLSLGLVLFFSGRSYGAALCFGFVGAMKLYPLIFFGLLLSRRQHRAIVFGMLVAVLVTAFSLWLVYPNFAVSWRLIQRGVDQFRWMYMLHLRPLEQGSDHSLWCFLKRSLPHMPRPDRLAPYLTAYLGVVAAGGLALYVLRIRHLPMINQVVCLTAAMLVLPPTSYDYTLMHLYVPWALLSLVAVRAWREQRQVAGLLPAMVCFGVLLAPEAEFIHLGESLGGPIKAVTLLVLFWVGLRYRFEDDGLDPFREGARLTALPDRSATPGVS